MLHFLHDINFIYQSFDYMLFLFELLSIKPFRSEMLFSQFVLNFINIGKSTSSYFLQGLIKIFEITLINLLS